MSVPDQQQAPLGADHRPEAYHPEPAGWVVGVTLFAAWTMMAVIGLLPRGAGARGALPEPDLRDQCLGTSLSFDLHDLGVDPPPCLEFCFFVTGFAVTTGSGVGPLGGASVSPCSA